MRVLVVFLFLVLALVAQGQNSSKKSDSLAVLKERFQKEYDLQTAKARAYAQQKKIPLSYRDANGHLVSLAGIEDDGVTPRYITVDNAGAAATTGVIKLREGGGLGLNLEGNGMIVGVWDEGIVLADHVEFDQRIIQTQGSALSEHSTHVSGTIMASGVNANAKGMAPKAKVTSWDWNNALSEMASLAAPDQTSLLFSNHSWGVLTGWAFNNGSWTWYGNSSISTQEDYRFGFYSSSTKSWDELAYSAPYFTICKSAGNDRNNTGTGSNPPDCDLGAGFDCLGDVAVAKNIITVGAVSKLPNYTGPSSVQMSSFSSWGPTDDGRIKPDLVGAGVNIFSTTPVSQTSYGSLSGTSMATPNVTGSLTLVQELYKQINGSYMRATTLKALALHTTKEAGDNPGPDYRFGWGLLDVEASAKTILQEDKVNVFIEERVLTNGQTVEFDLNPVQDRKITATIVWADPAANPVSPALDPTNLMLVNDLDIRIVDSGTGIYYPWTLNPSSPNAAATKGDNFRDNVEKIEFENPQARPYKLVVSNKGQLQGGSQAFSIIISYTSDNDNSLAYYWVGGSGAWSDPDHWSLTSGGASAGAVPTADDRVFFDENSFNGSSTVTFNDNAFAASIIWFANENVAFSLNDNSLTIGGNMIVNSEHLSSQGTGKIVFTGTKNAVNMISLNDNSFTESEFEFNGDAEWNVVGLAQVGGLTITEGHVNLKDQQIAAGSIVANSENEKTLDISNSTISGLYHSSIENDNLTLVSNGTTISTATNEPVDISWNGVSFAGELQLTGTDIEFEGNNTIDELVLNGSISVLGNNAVNSIRIKEGSVIDLAPGSVQSLTSNTVIASSSESPVEIHSAGPQAATLEFEGHYKLCFDNLVVTNVDATGSAVVNAGLNSEVTTSDNWLTEECNGILFSDFTYQFNCIGSLVQFTSSSTGDIEEWEWDFGDPDTESDVSTEENPQYIYEAEGTYTVTLTISNGSDVQNFSGEIVIGSNDVVENHIVLSGGKLHSFQTAASYQWYRDGEIIEGATTRSYDFMNEPGVYFVVIQNAGCNRASDPYVNAVTDIDNPQYLERSVSVYPNPTKGLINLEVPFAGIYEVYVYDSFGRMINASSHGSPKTMITLESLNDGIYLLQIVKDNKRVTRKVVVSRR